jgi:hypothetical protein
MTDFNQGGSAAVESAVTRLEGAWKQSPGPDLGQFLPLSADPARQQVLVELIKADIAHRRRAGDRKKVDDYLREWPELNDRPEIAVELLVVECLLDAAPGGPPSQGDALPMASGPDASLSKYQQILRHPVGGRLLSRAAEEQYRLTLDMLADQPAAHRAVAFHKATFRQLIERLPAVSLGTIACGPGCAFCCRLKAEVHAYEALGIADLLRQDRTPEELATLTRALRQRAGQLRTLHSGGPVAANPKCLFLDERDHCSIYARRPIHCVGLGSQSRDRCKAAFQSGDADSRLPAYMPIMACAEGVLSGATVAMRELGLEAGYYELSAAVLAALEAPAAAERWLRGERVFSGSPSSAKPPRAAPARAAAPSRNAPCPCGSSKKYKQCCLRKKDQG